MIALHRALSAVSLRIAGPAAIIALTACSVIPQADAPVMYRLPAAAATTSAAASPASPDSAPLKLSLRIATPRASASLDSVRIAVLPVGDEITAYQGVRWNDRAPVLLRNRLFDAFQASGAVAALSLDENNLHADLELGGTLRAFHSEYRDGRPVVVIRYDALLSSASAHQLIAARRFDIAVPATDTAVPRIVQAFGAASDQLAAQVLPWVLEHASAASAQPASSRDKD